MKSLTSLIVAICVLMFLSGLTLAQDKNTIMKTYYSPEAWSGEGASFSEWYTFVTQPSPKGYSVSDVKYELEGDRKCHAYGECKEVKRATNGAITFQFRMQGHNDDIHRRKATSRLAVTVTYKKG